MGRRTATTPEGAKRRFLEELRRGSTVGEAARAAGIGRRTAYDLRQRDETFAVDWADAIEEGTDHLIAAARKRAIDGSDTLLMFLIKARRPEFRESYKVEHSRPPTSGVNSPMARALRERVAADPEFAARLEEIVAGLRDFEDEPG